MVPPILALTAYAMKSEMEQILSAGMNAYVSKPIDKEQLFRTIERTLNPVNPEQESARIDPGYLAQVQIEKELAGRVDFSGFIEDYRSDLKVARQLLTLFVRDVPGRIVLIEENLEKKKSRYLADNFHSLTNNLSAVRLHLIGQVTRELEQQALAKNFNFIADKFQELQDDLGRSLNEAKRYLELFAHMK